MFHSFKFTIVAPIDYHHKVSISSGVDNESCAENTPRPILFSQRAFFPLPCLDHLTMSVQHLRSIVYVLYSLITYSDAFCVNKNSTCLDLCKGDRPFDPNDFSTDTYPWDIVCDDWEVLGPNSTISGRKFKSCLSCERTSSIYDPSTKIGDVYWLLCKAKRFQIFWSTFC